MSNLDSKSNKNTEKGDDGCIGNRRVRTIILSILCSVFFIMALPFINKNREDVADGGDISQTYDAAYSYMFAGAIVCIAGAIAVVLSFIYPNCDDEKLGRVAGFILIVGGIIYEIGWIIFIAENNEIVGLAAFIAGGFRERQHNAQITAWFGEASLPVASTILLGIDALFQTYQDEVLRLLSNFGLICLVSVLCIGAYYALICDDNEDMIDGFQCFTPDGVEIIATGYLILFCVCLIHVILYILPFFTCDCKDKYLVRVIIAVTLVIGGIITSIGYFVYVSADEFELLLGDKQVEFIVYFVGYCMLIVGLAVVCALDMAFDGVKNRYFVNNNNTLLPLL